MKRKNIIIALSITLNLILGLLFFYQPSKEGPIETGLAFKEAIRVENYRLAKSLITERRKDAVTEETLTEIHDIMSSGTGFITYELLYFDNGEMVLLEMIPDEDFKIQDLIIVPEEFREIFKR